MSKRFSDLTDDEVLALTAEDIERWVDVECAHEGVPLLPPMPVEPTAPKHEPDVVVSSPRLRAPPSSSSLSRSSTKSVDEGGRRVSVSLGATGVSMDIKPSPFILVVDDHEDTREMLRLGLDLSGIQSEGAKSASDALQAITENLPDAILLDIGLPDFDGYEVCRRLRQNPATRLTPIIAVTGWASATDVQCARDAGCNSVLTKPCEFDKVLLELQRHLPSHFPPSV